MSVDIIGYIKGYVTSKQLLDFIKKNYDVYATTDVEREISIDTAPPDIFYNKYKITKRYSGFINFCYNGEKEKEERALFYSYQNFDNDDMRGELPINMQTERTHMSLGCWGSAIEIISDLISEFGGGWIDKNDCDDEAYKKVEAKENGYIPVIHCEYR